MTDPILFSAPDAPDVAPRPMKSPAEIRAHMLAWKGEAEALFMRAYANGDRSAAERQRDAEIVAATLAWVIGEDLPPIAPVRAAPERAAVRR